MSERVGTLGDREQCHRCGGENVIWSAPSPLWNLVMRDGGDINGEPKYHDLVCLRCFTVIAHEVGLLGRWRLSLDPEPDGLVNVTPSGRVWDESRWLWLWPPRTAAPVPDQATGPQCAEGGVRGS